MSEKTVKGVLFCATSAYVEFPGTVLVNKMVKFLWGKVWPTRLGCSRVTWAFAAGGGSVG